MAETQALLSPKPSVAVEKSSSCCKCCSRGPLNYADISDAANEAVNQLIVELSQVPRVEPSMAAITGGRDTRLIDALQRMWSAVAADASDAFPTVPPKIPHREWKRLGFQGDDPTTDVRGAGVAGFTYLARFCEEYAEARVVGASCDVEMPLAIGSLNVLYMLRCHLQLFDAIPPFCPCCGSRIRDEYTSKQQYGGRHLRGFAMLLLDDPDIFFHIYALSVLVTANIWRKRFGVGKIMSTTTLKPPSAGRAKPIEARDGRTNSTTTQSTISNDGSTTLSAAAQADPRLLEFPEILRDAKELILDGLANFPPDFSSLKIYLFRRLRNAPDKPSSVPGYTGAVSTAAGSEDSSSPVRQSEQFAAGGARYGGAAKRPSGTAAQMGAGKGMDSW